MSWILNAFDLGGEEQIINRQLSFKPATPVGEFASVGTVMQSAASIAVLFVLVWFAIFLRGFWVPKASPQKSNGQRLQNPSAEHKPKKGKKGKKGRDDKKPRGPSLKRTISDGVEAIIRSISGKKESKGAKDLESPLTPSSLMSCENAPEDVSEDEEMDDAPLEGKEDEKPRGPSLKRTISDGLEAIIRSISEKKEPEDNQDESSCDLESPLIPSPLMSCENAPEAVSEDEELDDAPLERSKSLATVQKPLVANRHEVVHCEAALEPIEEYPEVASDLPMPEDCIYTSSLLLMHREIAVRIATGAPGLDRPPIDSSSTDGKLCCVR